MTGVQTCALPISPRAGDDALRPFEEAEAGPANSARVLRPSTLQRTIERDLPTGDVVYRIFNDGGEFDGASLARIESVGLDIGYTLTKRYRIAENDPLSAHAEIEQRALLRRGDWEVCVTCTTRLRATADEYFFSGELEALEGQSLAAHRRWDVSIPRNGM